MTQHQTQSQRRGITLMETAITMLIVAVLLSVTLPTLDSGAVGQLHAVSTALAADLELARSLAQRDNAPYTVFLTVDGWRIEFRRASTDTAPAPTLPTPAIAGVGGGYAISAAALAGRPVTVTGATVISSGGSTPSRVTSITFLPTSSTYWNTDVRVWLSIGSGKAMRSLPVRVAAVGGAVTVERDQLRTGLPTMSGSVAPDVGVTTTAAATSPIGGSMVASQTSGVTVNTSGLLSHSP